MTAAPHSNVYGGYDPAALDVIYTWIMRSFRMNEKINAALEEARRQRDEAGRSERGRLLSLVTTKIEEALAMWEYAERQEP